MNHPIYRDITDQDVGKALFELNGRQYPVSSFIGRILKQDVGKRVYWIVGILQVENNEQRTERLKAMNQTITLSPEERQILRAALASYKDHCQNREYEYHAASLRAFPVANEEAAKEYGKMKDDTNRLLCRIEE
jgi:hypothetical protein